MKQRHDTFIWYELMTTDQKASETFYGAVVGWDMADAGQENAGYTIVSAAKRGVGGIMTLPPEACEAGAKPGWFGYIAVADLDAAAKQTAESGGKIQRPPADIPNVGRFAVVADPGGAAFMLLTPFPQQQEPPAIEPSAPGHVSWHELYAGNGQEAAFAFYAKQFGWTTADLLDMGPMGKYRIFAANEVPIGGMMDKPPEAPAPVWNFYVNVDGIDAAIERIQTHGGQVVMGPQEVPGGSWIIQARDPQGATFALVSLKR